MLLLVLALFIAGTVIIAWTVAGRNADEAPESQEMAAGTLLSILVPKLNDKNALSAEMMFASLHGLLSKTPGLQEHLSFEIVATNDGIRFYVYLPSYFQTFVEGQIYAQYPNANITEVSQDYAHHFASESAVVTAAEVILEKEYFYPIKTFVDFAVDPLAAITGSVERLNQGEQVWMQILLRPIDDIWQEAGYNFVEEIRSGKSSKSEGSFLSLLGKDIANNLLTLPQDIIANTFSVTSAEAPEKKPEEKKVSLSAGQELELKAIENKMTKLGFETAIRIVSIGQSEHTSQQALASIIASLKQFTMTHLNGFQTSPIEHRAEEIFHDYQARSFPADDDSYFVLNTEELASVYHLPNLSVETPTIAWSKAKQLEPPLDLPQDVPTVFGKTAFRNRSTNFGIKREDRRRHTYMIGKTGTGKSTLMENMILNDILNGEGVAVMDPHGDMIDKLLDNIPEHRIDDVVLFDPGDAEYPVSLNMLELMSPDQKNLTASAMVDVFKRTFDSWGPRLEYILRNCFLTLAEVEGTTLLGVNRLLMDKEYRKFIVSMIEDEQLRAFWQKEYATMATNDKLITEAVAPIQNKVGQFLQTSTIRNMVGQSKSTIKIDEIMNTKKIFLVNLSKGKIGQDNSSLLGSMIIARLQSAAMTRVNIPEEERKDFYVYADEFQNFATTSFATILSEARKYRLNLVITHQYIDQLPEEVRNAVFGNVGTTIAFTIGPNDSQIISQQFAPVLTPEDLVALEKHHIYLKLMIDGMESRPFSAATLPPIARHEGHKAAIIAASRAKYAKPLSEVEERISRWTLKKFEVGVDDVALKERKAKQKAKAAGEDQVDAAQSDELAPTPAVDAQTVAQIKAAASMEEPKTQESGIRKTEYFAEQKQESHTSTVTSNVESKSPKLAEHNPKPANDHTHPTSSNGHSANGHHQHSNSSSSNGHANHAPNPTNGHTTSTNGHSKARVQHPQPHQTTKIIHGVPGGIGHTSQVEHIATSGSSGEITLHPSAPRADQT